MIILNSTFAGFTIMLGSWSIHLACAIAIMSVVPKINVEKPGVEEAGLTAIGVMNYLICMHVFMGFVAFGNQPNVYWMSNRAKYVLSIIAIVVYTFGMTEVCMEISQ